MRQDNTIISDSELSLCSTTELIELRKTAGRLIGVANQKLRLAQRLDERIATEQRRRDQS